MQQSHDSGYYLVYEEKKILSLLLLIIFKLEITEYLKETVL